MTSAIGSPSSSNTRNSNQSSFLANDQIYRKKSSSHQRCLYSGRHGGDLSLSNYLHNRPWRTYKDIDLTRMARNFPPFLRRLDYMKRLPVHNGCVNTICWNKTGEYILSGSDDSNLCVTKPGCLFDKTNDYTVIHKVQTRHLGNIFRAQFLPNSGDKQIVSCSSEGPIIVHDINSIDPSEGLLSFNCHSETVFEVVTVPDNDRIFLSCGEDKTIRLFDMRVHNSCARAGTCPHPALIRNSHAVTTLTLHPLNSNLMLVGRADGVGLVYDRRKLPDVTNFTRERIHEARMAGEDYPSYHFKHPLEGVISQFVVPQIEERCRFTSLCYNQNGSEVLASYSGDYIYLFTHDHCSNFELIRTLPKKTAKSATESGETGANGDTNGNRQSTELQQGSEEIDPSERTSRASRISRIRVRGDWSDTGVNSVPHSQRRQDGDSSHRPSFLERMAVSLSARQRYVPVTEIVAGPIEYFNTTNRSEPDIEEVEEEAADDTSENSTLIDEDDVSVLRDDDDDGDGADDDDMHDNENYASFIVENLVGQATEEAGSRMARGNESSGPDHYHHQSDISDNMKKNDSDAGSEGSSRPRISPKTKAKFKETVDSLKARYSLMPTHHPRVMYQGHRNSRTSFKEAVFWGDDFIMSGSDCGRIIVWEKNTAKIVMGFKADERVVNCLAPNPNDYVLASSGIDYDIKLWSTQNLKESPLVVSDEEMQRIVNNNELMLEESKHTLSVPPHLFFRVLASLVQSSR